MVPKKLYRTQAAQAQVVCHMILQNSGHSEIIRVCMGILILRYALENTNTTKFSIKIPYLTSMVSYLLSVPLLSRFVAIFASFSSLGPFS